MLRRMIPLGIALMLPVAASAERRDRHPVLPNQRHQDALPLAVDVG